jgi:hypothetical protein
MIVTDDKPSPFVPAVIVFAVFTVVLCLATIVFYVRIQMMTKNKKVEEEKPVENPGGAHVELSGFDTARSAADTGRSGADAGIPSEPVVEGVKSEINKSNKPDDNIANKAVDIEKQEEKKEEEPAADIKKED